jgi:poly(A) polymerase
MGMTERFPWLDEAPLAGLLECLDQGGEEARVVGGAVRNALLGEPVGEWDVATTALPDEVARRARAKGWKIIPTGIEHGTVTVIAAGRPFEVTTLRQDVETDGRHAVVRFGRDFEADAFRRDFTINALSVGRDGQLHDYAGGLADLRARRVRFIGDPDQRIAEDYLRILRLFRFHARYGEGPIDPSSLGAAIRSRGASPGCRGSGSAQSS